MNGMARLIWANWPLVAVAMSVAALAVAIGSEIFAGLLPCSLCLRQRQVFILAIVAGIAGWLVGQVRITGVMGSQTVIQQLTCYGLAVVFGIGAVLAFYHAGVEWGWFAGPASCSAGRLDLDNLVEQLRQPVETVSCSQAAIRILGLSMAGWNVLYCGVLMALSIYAGRKGFRK